MTKQISVQDLVAEISRIHDEADAALEALTDRQYALERARDDLAELLGNTYDPDTFAGRLHDSDGTATDLTASEARRLVTP